MKFSIDDLVKKLGLGNLNERQAKVAMFLGLAAVVLIGLVSFLPSNNKPEAIPSSGSGSVSTEVNSPIDAKDETSNSGQLDELSRYTRQLESKVQDNLSRVDGAGHVWVTINIEQGETREFATNKTTESRTVSERDTSGGVKSTTESTTTATVVSMRGAGNEDSPVLVTRVQPKIAGVLIVAEGAVDSAVKYELTEAASTLLGVPPHRILVAGAEPKK